MMISEEQVRRAVEYLQTTGPNSVSASSRLASSGDVSVELVDRVRMELATTPDFREDRVAQARALLAAGPFSSAEVAEKMIGRIISDSIR